LFDRDNRYQRDKKRKLCKRRAAIEPIIGHLKSDFRLSRNLLKGQVGDEINVLMAQAAISLIFKRDLCINSQPLKTQNNQP
jgi:IS5 family transposase